MTAKFSLLRRQSQIELNRFAEMFRNEKQRKLTLLQKILIWNVFFSIYFILKYSLLQKLGSITNFSTIQGFFSRYKCT